jgi:hypothetical protein
MQAPVSMPAIAAAAAGNKQLPVVESISALRPLLQLVLLLQPTPLSNPSSQSQRWRSHDTNFQHQFPTPFQLSADHTLLSQYALKTRYVVLAFQMKIEGKIEAAARATDGERERECVCVCVCV